ncbi:MAG: NUDIX hydrolase [Candidatus Colwellbacteria bacterium]|nr:NUDIX hydrolase [Candidatus Colwellbacteria bacterium]
MEVNNNPIFIAGGVDAPHPELPFVERNAITAIVRNPRNGTYLGLRWKQVDWDTFITGGIEEGQTAEEAARREVCEESGYKHLRLVTELPRFHSKFYHKPKGENRFAHFQSFFFELEDEERDALSDEEQEKHECVWLGEDEIKDFHLPEGHRFIFNCIPKS